MPQFKERHVNEIPRVIDYFIETSSTLFGVSLGNIKGVFPHARIVILFDREPDHAKCIRQQLIHIWEQLTIVVRAEVLYTFR